MRFGQCRVCGCDDNHACRTPQGPCFWVEDDLCSACFDLLRRHQWLTEDSLKKIIRRAKRLGVSAETLIRKEAKKRKEKAKEAKA